MRIAPRSIARRETMSITVPGVPMTTCASTRVPLFHPSLTARKVLSGTNLPICWMTASICRASSREGARQRA